MKFVMGGSVLKGVKQIWFYFVLVNYNLCYACTWNPNFQISQKQFLMQEITALHKNTDLIKLCNFYVDHVLIYWTFDIK